jgi:hypothetical protein
MNLSINYENFCEKQQYSILSLFDFLLCTFLSFDLLKNLIVRTYMSFGGDSRIIGGFLCCLHFKNPAKGL